MATSQQPPSLCALIMIIVLLRHLFICYVWLLAVFAAHFIGRTLFCHFISCLLHWLLSQTAALSRLLRSNSCHFLRRPSIPNRKVSNSSYFQQHAGSVCLLSLRSHFFGARNGDKCATHYARACFFRFSFFASMLPGLLAALI